MFKIFFFPPWKTTEQASDKVLYYGRFSYNLFLVLHRYLEI